MISLAKTRLLGTKRCGSDGAAVWHYAGFGIHNPRDRGARVAIVERWTGAEASALRQALRLSVRAFAERELGVSVRTVTSWESRGVSITLLPTTQAIMDTTISLAAST